MTFSKDTKLTEVPRLARHLALATLLIAPIPSQAALHPPQRPASVATAQTPNGHRKENANPTRYRGPHTYLAMIGPGALSFAENEPALPLDPVMPDPPKLKSELNKTASATNTPAKDADTTGLKPLDSAIIQTDLSSQPANGTKPVSILPDDTRHEIRAEDVLPYFQFPSATDSGSSAPLTVNPPQTATAPLSTATYRQQ